MYIPLKPNKHKRISSNTTTMASLVFIGSLPPKILWPPLNLISNYFGLKFLAPPPPNISGGAATMFGRLLLGEYIVLIIL